MICCNWVSNLISFCTVKQWQLKMTDMGHSLVEYSLFTIFVQPSQMDLYKYSASFVYSTVWWQYLFWVPYHTTVCACHFKTIFFSSWGRAFFIFFITSWGNVGGGGEFTYWWNWKQHWGTNMPTYSEKMLWSLFKWGWDCWALHCEWLCSE